MVHPQKRGSIKKASPGREAGCMVLSRSQGQRRRPFGFSSKPTERATVHEEVVFPQFAVKEVWLGPDRGPRGFELEGLTRDMQDESK